MTQQSFDINSFGDIERYLREINREAGRLAEEDMRLYERINARTGATGLETAFGDPGGPVLDHTHSAPGDGGSLVVSLTDTVNGTPGSVFFAGTNGVIQQKNARLFWDDTNDYLGVNMNTPAAHVEINAATATDTGLIIQTTDDNTTENLVEIHDSGGVILSSVDAGGRFGVGVDATPNRLEVQETVTRTAVGEDIKTIKTLTAVNPAGNSTATFHSIDAQINTTTNFNLRNVVASRSLVSAAGAGSTTLLLGHDYVISATGTRTITTASAFRAGITQSSAGNMSNARIVDISGATGTGSITTIESLRIRSSTITPVLNRAIAIDNIFANNPVNAFAILTNAGNVAFNDGGDADTDFRVESNTCTHMLFVDAGFESVLINSSADLSSTFGVVTTAAADIGAVIRGSAAQSAHLLVLQTSAPANFFESSTGLAGSATVWNQQGVDIDFVVEGAGSPNAFFVQGSDGKVGLGTATIPHGAIGVAQLALEGANASALAGPHIQITTASDDYPLLQVMSWAHDEIAINFDMYSDGINWRSSDAGSNFQIIKTSDFFNIRRESGNAAGSIISPDLGIVLDTSGMVGINEDTNTDMTTGLTVNQGSSDDEILALKSSDVAHGVTNIAETDTYGMMRKSDADGGCLSIEGFVDTGAANDTAALYLSGTGQSNDTSSGAAAQGFVNIVGYLRSGSGRVNSSDDDANILVIRNGSSTVHRFTVGGDYHPSGDVYFLTGTGIIHADGVVDGQYLRADGTRYVPHTLVPGDLPAHNLLSATHGDTVVQGVTRGSLIYGNSTPKWDELVHPGGAGYAFTTTATDVAWDQTPNWTGDHTWTSAVSAKPVLTIENTNADATAPVVHFYKNTASPADGDSIGAVEFFGRTSTGAIDVYAFMLAESLDVTNADFAGGLQFTVLMDATERNLLELSGYNGSVNEGEVVVNQDGQDVDFRVEASGVADALFVQGSDGFIGVGTNAPNQLIDVFKSQNSHMGIIIHNPNVGVSATARLTFITDGGSSFIYRTSDAYAVAAIQDDLVIQEDGGGDIVMWGAAEIARFTNGGNAGVGTTTPGVAFGGGAMALSGVIVEVENTGGAARLAVDGNPAVLNMADNGGGANDKALSFAVDAGVGRFLSSNDDGTNRVNNILVMDMGTGNIGIAAAAPGSLMEWNFADESLGFDDAHVAVSVSTVEAVVEVTTPTGGTGYIPIYSSYGT